MSRRAAAIRDATPGDVPALVSLWTELRALSRETGRLGRSANAATVAGVEERFVACIKSDTCRVIVAALDDDTVVGMAVLSLSRIGQLLETTAVQLSHLVVAARYRKRGVGRALVAAAVEWAEEIGSDEVVVNVYPSLREGNRFYARLGFAPLVVRRVAPTAALRRRLAALEGRPLIESRSRRRMPGRAAAGLRLRGRLSYVDESRGIVLPDVT